MKKHEIKEKPLSLKIESKIHHLFIILSTLFAIILSIGTNYKNYTYNEGFNFLFLCIALVTLGLLYFLFNTIFKTDFAIRFDEESLTVKRSFNRNTTIKYNEITKIDITYNGSLLPSQGTKFEGIFIWRKTGKSFYVIIERGKVDLRESSNFLKCINFLATKTLATIHINNIYKKVWGNIKTRANLEWSDNPDNFHKK